MASHRGGSVGNANQMMDLMKANMLLNSKENPIYTFIVMTFLEIIIKYVNILLEFSKSSADRWISKKFNTVVDKLPIDKDGKEAKCEIIFDRNYAKSQKIEEYTKVDAIIYRIMDVPDIKNVIFTRARYIINYKDAIDVQEGIKFQLINSEFDGDGDIESIKFRLYSSNHNAEELKHFVSRCESDYEVIKRNKLGDNLFYFDQVLLTKAQKESDVVPDKVMFNRNLFLTNRTLDNVFLEQMNEIRTRLDLFENHKEWYARRGIPHTLGLLLFGSPGAGKTSLVKAIAKQTGRHIMNINFGKIKRKSQLKQLFYDDKLWVMEKGDFGENIDSYVIPIHKRLYLLEDLDAIEGSPLLRRDLIVEEEDKQEEEAVEDTEDKVEEQLQMIIGGYNKENDKRNYKLEDEDKINNKLNNKLNVNYNTIETPKESEENFIANLLSNHKTPKESEETFITNMEEAMDNPYSTEAGPQFVNGKPKFTRKKEEEEDNKKEKDKEEVKDDDLLDLSAVLNILDGTLETPGRMIILTSNYPERLDQALIRPGRIDLILEFKKANREIIKQMYECYLEQKADEELVEQIPEYLWSPAELGQIFFKNYNNPEQALRDLIDNTPQSYFKYSYFDKFDEKEDEM